MGFSSGYRGAQIYYNTSSTSTYNTYRMPERPVQPTLTYAAALKKLRYEFETYHESKKLVCFKGRPGRSDWIETTHPDFNDDTWYYRLIPKADLLAFQSYYENYHCYDEVVYIKNTYGELGESISIEVITDKQMFITTYEKEAKYSVLRNTNFSGSSSYRKEDVQLCIGTSQRSITRRKRRKRG